MNPAADSLYCSFCYKSQSNVGQLISSPGDRQRVYICDECILVCASIIDDQGGRISLPAGTPVTSPLLRHRLSADFLDSVERWITKDSLGIDASEDFAEVRSIASRMVAGE